MDDSAPVRAPVSRREAFAFWLKLGCIGFGGPAGQIALMHAELVQRRRWISEKRFMHALHYCMLLPGPEAQQLATYIGWLMHRSWGGVVAGVLFVLPSLFILIALSWLYMAYGQLSWVAAVFYGIKPAVTAIVLQAAVRIGGRALRTRWHWAIAGASFLAITVLGWPFPLIVAAAALAGYFGGRLAPQAFGGAAPAAPAPPGQARAWLDDDSPPPAHARFSWTGLRRVLLAGLLLWGVPMGWLCGLYGWDHALTQMGWFFTKAALLTFGGA
ncbi:MAG: chromate transporter, partial [Limnohabitans sp.]